MPTQSRHPLDVVEEVPAHRGRSTGTSVTLGRRRSAAGCREFRCRRPRRFETRDWVSAAREIRRRRVPVVRRRAGGWGWESFRRVTLYDVGHVVAPTDHSAPRLHHPSGLLGRSLLLTDVLLSHRRWPDGLLSSAPARPLACTALGVDASWLSRPLTSFQPDRRRPCRRPGRPWNGTMYFDLCRRSDMNILPLPLRHHLCRRDVAALLCATTLRIHDVTIRRIIEMYNDRPIIHRYRYKNWPSTN